MKSNRLILTAMLTIVLVILGACGKSSVETNAKSNEQPKVQEDSSNHTSTSTNSDDGESQESSNDENTVSQTIRKGQSLNRRLASKMGEMASKVVI